MITGHGAARRRRDHQTPPLCAVGGGSDAQRPMGTEGRQDKRRRGERGILCATATDDTSRGDAAMCLGRSCVAGVRVEAGAPLLRRGSLRGAAIAGVCRGARRHDGSVLAEDLHAGEDEGGRQKEEGGSVVSAHSKAAHSCP